MADTGNPFIDAFVAANPVLLVVAMYAMYISIVYVLDLKPAAGAKPTVELKCPEKCPNSGDKEE